MNPKLAFAARIGSALVATLVTCGLMPILAPGAQKHPPALIVISAIIMSCAGWIYVGTNVRAIGLTHAFLMVGVGSYLLFIGVPFFLNRTGMTDNPAAGAIELANLVLVVSGIMTLICGMSVIISAFANKKL
jgi:hypothetical protein